MSLSQDSQQRFKWLLYAAILLLSSSAVLLWPTRVSVPLPKNDFGLSWSVPFGDLVAMTITNSARFELDGEDSALEWAALIPRGGHTVHVMQPGDNQPTTYTVTLFHQLKCLDFIRQDFVYMNRTNAGPNIMTSHCVNYLRQTILCRPNLRLESVRNTHLNAGRMQYDAACNDWERVYEETGRNHAAYAAWRNESSI